MRFCSGILMMLAAAAALPHAGGAESFRRGLDPSSSFSPAGMQRDPPLRLHGGMQAYDPIGISKKLASSFWEYRTLTKM